MIYPAVAITILLIIILILLRIRRKKLSSKPKPTTQETKPIDTVASSTEPVQAQETPESLTPEKPVVTAAEPVLQAKKSPETAESLAPAQQEKTVATPTEAENRPAVTQIAQTSRVAATSYFVPVYNNRNVPQDSMLRRHYITHIYTMITELNQTCPTDSMLRRHYHAHIATQLDQCLNDEHVMQQLFCCYEDNKKTLASPVQKPQAAIISSSDNKATCEEADTPVTTVAAPRKDSKIPEDSMLRRHYLTNLYAQVADTLPVRPTDSTLRRHYDTMLENEVKKRLCS